MNVFQKAMQLTRRRDLALKLASRPKGVTAQELARAMSTSEQTARNLLDDLDAQGVTASELGPVKAVQSPGRPAKVHRTTKAA